MPSIQQIARLQIESQGFEKARRDVEGLSRASTDLNTAVQAAGASIRTTERQVNSLERTIDASARASQDFSAKSALLNRALNDGTITAERHGRLMGLLEQRYLMAQRAVGQNAQAVATHSNVVSMNRGQLQQLSFQLNDVATMALSGASAFQILATQGGQIFQIFQQGQGGVGGSIKALGNSLMGLATPARLAGGLIAGVAVAGVAAWSAWDDKIRALQISMNGLGRASGETLSGLTRIAERAAATGPLSLSQSMSGAATFAGAGIDGQMIAQLLSVTRRFSGAFGMSVGDGQGELAKAFANPVQGLDDLAKRFGPFGYEVEQTVKRLAAMGRIEESRQALFKAFEDRLRTTTDATGVFAKAMEGVKNVVDRLWGALGRVGAERTTEEKIQDLRAQASRRGAFFAPNRQARISQQIDDLQEKQALEQRAAWVAQRQVENDRLSKEAAQIREIKSLSEVAAASIMARTAAEKLAVEQERIRREALFDTTKAVTEAADKERARTIAIAEANKALDDFARKAKDEMSLSGASSPAERVRKQIEIEMRDLYERSNVLPADGRWRSQVKLGDESRAGNLFQPSPISPFNTGPFGFLPLTEFTPNLTRRQMMGLGEDPRRILDIAGPRPSGLPPRGLPPDIEKIGKELEQSRLKDLWNPAFEDLAREIKANDRMLRANAEAFGKSTYEATRLTEAARLENMIKKQGLDVTEEMAEAIKKLSHEQAQYAVAAEQQARTQRQVIESMDFARSSLSDAFASPLKAMARGESPAKALQQSSMRMFDRMIDMSANSLISGILGPMGKAGGGLFGDLLGGLLGKGLQTAAVMNVNAGMVNLGGAGVLSGGSGGGIFDVVKSFFGGGGNVGPGTGTFWANGGAFSGGSVIPFANGAVIGGPTTFPMRNGSVGLMGEAGPEAIMPLRRGPDGRLGVSAGSAGAGNGKVNVQVVNNGGTQLGATAEETRGQDGSRNIRITLDQMLTDSLMRGAGRSVLEKHYGARRLGR